MQSNEFFGLELKEWLIVAATFLGPILAVQAQKWVEAFRERRRRKISVFEQLMATRGSRVSPEHVRALNMIDLVFYGEKTKGDELFTNLLFATSKDLGFRFDRVQLKRGTYTPIAHGEIEAEQTELRRATLSLVTGKHALQMNVVGFPVDPDAVEANKVAIQNIGKALESGVLQVEVTSKD